MKEAKAQALKTKGIEDYLKEPRMKRRCLRVRSGMQTGWWRRLSKRQGARRLIVNSLRRGHMEKLALVALL